MGMKPEKLWYISTRLHQRGLTPLAKLLKTANYVLFKAILPYECRVSPDVSLYHRGTGTVVLPNTTVGSRVAIAHNVTLGGQGATAACSIVIEDGVTVGAGAVIMAKAGTPLVVGSGAIIGANATITASVPPGAVMVGPKAIQLDRPAQVG